jgi:peptide/nickel transport system substrate-binding protein
MARKEGRMESTWARRIFAILSVGLALFVTGRSADAQVRGGTLRVRVGSDYTTLDPAYNTMPTERAVLHQVVNTLVRVDRNLHVAPELAESWKWENETTLTLTLRKGVKFHDGTDFDAAAVKFNIERILDPATKSRLKAELSEVKAVEAVDPHTVRFLLNYPSAGLLATLSHAPAMMLSPAAVKKLGQDIGRHPVGTGPFRFVEWVRDDHVTVERFDGYWERGLPYLDRIVFRPIPDTNVAVLGLKTGTLDFIDSAEPKDVAGLRARRDLVYVESPGLNYYMIRLNLGQPPFDNRLVRLALAHAIDREAIAKGLFFGTVRVAPGPITAASWAYSPELKGYGRDVARAKTLLADTGKPGGVRFEMQTLPDPLTRRMGEAIKAQTADAGIDITLAPGESGKLMQNSLTGNYQAMLSYRTGMEDPDGSTFRDFYSTGPFNRMKYSNPKMDELLVKARSTFSTEERKALYSQVQQLVLEDSPMIFLVEMPTGQAMNARVKNFTHYPNREIYLRDVWLEK